MRDHPIFLESIRRIRQLLGDQAQADPALAAALAALDPARGPRRPATREDDVTTGLVELLGEPGRHARVAVGVAELPLGAAVEVAVVALID